MGLRTGKKILLWLICALTAVLVFGAMTRCVPAKEPDPAAGAKGLFYRIEGGKDTVYLFGSVHMGKKDLYPLDDRVYEAFEKSNVLGLELDLDGIKEAARQRLIRGRYPQGRVMTDLVCAKTFAQAAQIMEEQGISPIDTNQFKPWFAAKEISVLAAVDAGYHPALGLEYYFLKKAKNSDMPIIGLESPSAQIDPFDLLSDQSQVLYLKDALQAMDEGQKHLHAAATHWQKGDADFFARRRQAKIHQAQTPSLQAFYKAMLDGRDQNMADGIEGLLVQDTENTYFLVVGAMHLAGENSIPHILQKRGYGLKPMVESPEAIWDGVRK